MKRSLTTALCLFATAGAFTNPAWQRTKNKECTNTFPSSFAFPSSGKWHLGLDISQGLCNYELRANYARNDIFEYESPTHTLAYRLASRQFFGYGRVFSVELREAINFGFVGSAVLFSNLPGRLLTNHLVNLDGNIGVPISLSKRLRLTFRPLAGFGFNQLKQYANADSDNPNVKIDYRLRLWSPFVGFGFGLAPTKRFSVHSKMAVHFPKGKHEYDNSPYDKLNIQRHGLSLTLSTAYQLTSCMQWTAEFDHAQFSVYGYVPDVGGYYDIAHLSQTSLTGGLQWSF